MRGLWWSVRGAGDLREGVLEDEDLGECVRGKRKSPPLKEEWLRDQTLEGADEVVIKCDGVCASISNRLSGLTNHPVCAVSERGHLLMVQPPPLKAEHYP